MLQEFLVVIRACKSLDSCVLQGLMTVIRAWILIRFKSL